MQFIDKSDDKDILLSPTKKTTTTSSTSSANQLMKIIVSDVVVDLSSLTGNNKNNGNFQMMYVDIKWRNKSLRTVASAKKIENNKNNNNTTSKSNSKSSSSSTFSGERAEISNKGDIPLEEGTDDVVIVTLRRCEVFGDSDLSCVAFRLSDVPWIKKSPVVVCAGPFMLSLQPETFGHELPPELTLAERIDAAGGPVEVVVGTGDRARAKQVPFPPSDDSLRRKEALSHLDGPNRRKNRDASDPLSDGTADAVERRKRKEKEMDELKKKEEREAEEKEKNQVAVVKKEEETETEKEDDLEEEQRIPQVVQEIIDCQVPPEPPVLATLGIDLEIDGGNNNSSSSVALRDPSLLHNAVNAAAPALAAAAKHDINQKLLRDVQNHSSEKNDNTQEQQQQNQNDQIPSNYFNVDLSSISTVINNNVNSNNNNNNNNNNSSSSPMTLLLNVEVKPNDRNRLLDPELMERIRRVLEREESSDQRWGPKDFPNVARCIIDNVTTTTTSSDQNNNNDSNNKAQQPKSTNEISTNTTDEENNNTTLFSRVECTNCEVAPKLNTDQLAEQQRIMSALETKPLEIIANPNMSDPAAPLRWRGTLPDERCPHVPVVYRRDKYTVNALISVNLLPILADSSPARKGFFSALSDKVVGAVEKVSSSIDSDRLLSDFPELRSQMWTNGQSTDSQKMAVAAVFDCQALNGFGLPLSGKLYMTASEMFFQTSSSSSSSSVSNPAGKIHWRACFANEILCVRRVVAFGSEAFQVFMRGGTCMQFQNFDGFFARAGLAVGLRNFTKFFEAWMIVLDLWHSWRAPVQSSVKRM